MGGQVESRVVRQIVTLGVFVGDGHCWIPEDRVLVVYLPIHTVSEANRASHEHWSKRSKRASSQRGPAALVMGAHVRNFGLHLPVFVLLTRIAPRLLDDDNLSSSLKACRDSVADAFGVDDRGPSIVWEYAQRRGKPKEYGVEIRVQERP